MSLGLYGLLNIFVGFIHLPETFCIKFDIIRQFIVIFLNRRLLFVNRSLTAFNFTLILVEIILIVVLSYHICVVLTLIIKLTEDFIKGLIKILSALIVETFKL
jgi:hypothetical protein